MKTINKIQKYMALHVKRHTCVVNVMKTSNTAERETSTVIVSSGIHFIRPLRSFEADLIGEKEGYLNVVACIVYCNCRRVLLMRVGPVPFQDHCEDAVGTWPGPCKDRPYCSPSFTYHAE
jgi:hypothetical protein